MPAYDSNLGKNNLINLKATKGNDVYNISGQDPTTTEEGKKKKSSKKAKKVVKKVQQEEQEDLPVESADA